MSTQQQRQEWRELAAAATPGEWGVVRGTNDARVWAEYGASVFVAMCPDTLPYFNTAQNANADAAFIAAARAAVPQLLADVDALQAERDALAAELERVRAQLDAVPVDDIRKVTKAADMDGYSNWRVDEWLDELAQP